jgi:integrase/recombinase XerD
MLHGVPLSIRILSGFELLNILIITNLRTIEKFCLMRNPNAFDVSFYIRQNKNKPKDYGIYCCIKVQDQRPKEMCVLNSIKKQDWDMVNGMPKKHNDDLVKLALYLDKIKTQLITIYLDLRLKGEAVSAGAIKNIYLGKESTDYTILQLIDKAIQKYKVELAPGSLKNYSATKDYLTAFCLTKYKAGDVLLKFLSYSFIDELKTYILTHPLKPNDPCSNNGCMKHLERLKKMMTWACEMGFIDRNVFAPFKIRKKRYESKILHLDQLRILENKVLRNPMLDLVKDLFVFCCYTGMAPIDLQSLKPHQIYTGSDELTWLSYTRAKSSIPANVPLLSPASAILQKHRWKQGDIKRATVFPVITNKDLNANLKIISEICEVGFPLNFYIARHTFATTVTLAQGVPITSIKEMMGHNRIETTMTYARTDNSILARDMMQLQDNINR